MDAISKMRCVACNVFFPDSLKKPGVWPSCGPVEVHHITSAGRRLGHDATLPLGSWHHRGTPRDGLRPSQMEQVYGPSLALNKRAFVRCFGLELELLQKVNAALRENV
jgi:hypothetical protein